MEEKKELRVVGILSERKIGSRQEFTIKKADTLPRVGETVKFVRIGSDGMYYIGKVERVDRGKNTYWAKFISEGEDIPTR